jgi:predicted dithiol-disulfide oxidoreductase (DUF899 family)
MFGHEYTAGCPSCSAIADGFDGFGVHLANHDVTLCAVSRAPLAKLRAFKRRMGWSFPWASSFDSDFNYDFQVAHTEEQQQSGAVEYNNSQPSGRLRVVFTWSVICSCENEKLSKSLATYQAVSPGERGLSHTPRSHSAANALFSPRSP